MRLFNDTELFTSGEQNDLNYDLEDGSLALTEHFYNKEKSDQLYDTLLKEIAWKNSQITIYGKVHDTPRLTAWYGDENKNYTFSGTKLSPLPWTKTLQEIKEQVEAKAGFSFNSVLLNLYRDGKDSVGWHRDNEIEFGTNPVIASLSFGETRPFHLRHKFKKELQKIILPLTHGSLLVMKGSTQHFWEHQVPKTAKTISPRINLTFRLIKTVR